MGKPHERPVRELVSHPGTSQHEQRKPGGNAQAGTGGTGHPALPGGLQRLVGQQHGGNHDPKQEHVGVHQHPDEAGPKHRVGMQPLLYHPGTFSLNGHGVRQQVPDSKKCHRKKTDQLHRCPERGILKQTREPAEGDDAVDHLHQQRADRDDQRPCPAAVDALLHNGDIDRPHRYRAHEPGQHPRANGHCIIDRGHLRAPPGLFIVEVFLNFPSQLP